MNTPRAKIYRDIILPITREYEAESIDIREDERYRCELFFGVQHCKIFLLQCIKPFLIPGQLVDENGIIRYGIDIDRQANVGEKFLIRLDKTQYDRVDLQYAIAEREDSFRLTHFQFKSLKNKLKVI